MGKTFPNESDAYRQARNELLKAEVALRNQIEAVAAMRRQLPVGGAVNEDYVFDELVDGQLRQVKLSELFGQHGSLFLYGFMYGPNAENPCPLCSSMLDALDGNAKHIAVRTAVAVVARSGIERVQAWAEKRGWRNLRLLSSANNTYHADYFAEDAEGRQLPMANVFVRGDDGAIHHQWGSELFFESFEDGAPRHMDLVWPLWNVFDLVPEGRGDWWPPLWVEG